MFSAVRIPVACFLLLALSGCAKPSDPSSPTGSGSSTTTATPGIWGRVTADGQGVASAAINLYAVGTSGDGTPATSLLDTSVTSDTAGNFNLIDKFTCPAQTTPVVLVASGGHPGDSATANSALALMLAVGQCSQLNTTDYYLINETNTVAAVASLAPFITSPSAIGSSGSDAAILVAGMVTARQFVNVGSGVSPGDAPPSGDDVPSQLINTLASVIATCTSTTGGAAGDSSRCGKLFTFATPPGGAAPTNTIAALIDIAANPTLNTQALFDLAPPKLSFQPALATVPPDFSIQMIQPTAPTLSAGDGLAFSPTPRGVTSATQTITLQNDNASAISISAPAVLGASAADFALTSSCTGLLQPRAICALTVTFRPTISGAASAYLFLPSGATNVQYIPLSGSAS